MFRDKNGPEQVVDMWRNVGQVFKKLNRVKNHRFARKYMGFLAGENVREEEGEKESIQAFFRRSLEFRRSKFVEPRTKVHLLDEGYACVPKMRSFTEDLKEDILGNQRF